MVTHPDIAAALAEQHRHDLIAQASAYRLTRAARDSRSTRPGWSPQQRHRTGPMQGIRRAAAAAAAAAVLMMTPTGAATTPHVSAHVFAVHSSHHFQ